MVDAVVTSRPSAGGGGGSFTADSPPTPADETAQLFGQVVTDTRPEILYLFNGNVTNDGNLGAAGHGTATGITYAEALGATIADFGDAAVFTDALDAIAVGGYASPFKLSANDGRGDFEMVFRFRFEAVDKLYTLVSTDTTTLGTTLNTTNGFYSVLVDTASASAVKFEYTLAGTLNLLTWTAGTLVVDTDYHLVVSFKANIDTFGGDGTGVGVFRCFLDGVALADEGNASNKFIASPAGVVDVGFQSGSTNWPLSLGRYLNGTAVEAVTGDVILGFDGNLDDLKGGPAGSIIGNPLGNASNAQYEASPLGGQQIRIQNTSNTSNNNYVTIPNPLTVGNSAFTIDFWVKAEGGSSYHGNNEYAYWLSDYQYPSNSGNALALYAFSGSNAASHKIVFLNGGNGNVSWNYDWGNPGSSISSGTGDQMVHIALVREAQIGTKTNVKLAVNGIWKSPATSSNVNANNFSTTWLWYLGKHYSYGYNPRDASFDELRITMSGTLFPASNFNNDLPARHAGFDSADRDFAGKMDEFAVYNKRCIHDTSETFEKPVLPIRDTALTIAAGMDSEGAHGQIVTTRNAGYVIPNSQQGLPGASLYNEDGFVKIRPV